MLYQFDCRFPPLDPVQIINVISKVKTRKVSTSSLSITYQRVKTVSHTKEHLALRNRPWRISFSQSRTDEAEKSRATLPSSKRDQPLSKFAHFSLDIIFEGREYKSEQFFQSRQDDHFSRLLTHHVSPFFKPSVCGPDLGNCPYVIPLGFDWLLMGFSWSGLGEDCSRDWSRGRRSSCKSGTDLSVWFYRKPELFPREARSGWWYQILSWPFQSHKHTLAQGTQHIPIYTKTTRRMDTN